MISLSMPASLLPPKFESQRDAVKRRTGAQSSFMVAPRDMTTISVLFQSMIHHSSTTSQLEQERATGVIQKGKKATGHRPQKPHPGFPAFETAYRTPTLKLGQRESHHLKSGNAPTIPSNLRQPTSPHSVVLSTPYRSLYCCRRQPQGERLSSDSSLPSSARDRQAQKSGLLSEL